MGETAPQATNQQMLRLSALLQLQLQARAAKHAELGFLMVNETIAVVPYVQAAFWQPHTRKLVLSGAGSPDQDGPYATWMRAVLRQLARLPDAGQIRACTEANLPPALAAGWREHLPEHALWCPLATPDGVLTGGLLLARHDPWTDGEATLLHALTASYAQALAWHHLRRRRRLPRLHHGRRNLLLGGVALLIVAAMMLPVRSSILAPAEVVPVDPTPIRAPFAGVIESVLVAPNALVKAGDALLTLDTSQLASRVEVAQKALELAQVEYAQVSREAVADVRARGRLALLKSKMEQQAAELGYQTSLLQRARVVAATDGIAVFNDASDWIGRPVEIGERIMLIAAPSSRLIEMQVPVAEIATFAVGSEVQFFGNIAPDQPVAAKLSFASYGSATAADGVLSYVFRADLDAGAEPQRLGLKGTAKVYGERRPLLLWLLRRPLASVRQWLAL
jgi:hypothetical protein